MTKPGRGAVHPPITEDAAGFDLAMELEQLIAGKTGAVVLHGCCWLLAGLALQTHDARGESLDHIVDLFTQNLRTCIARLATLSPTPKEVQ